MSEHYADLRMYVAPQPIQQANQRWLARILERLKLHRLDADHLDLPGLWLSPQLLVSQTCGYPLMTQLRGQVRIIGRPRYELVHSSHGEHCSLLLTRVDNPRNRLAQFYQSRGVINGHDSNSGMSLLRHCVAPLQRDGRFFASVGISGAHRESLRWLREDRADLAAIDSVTYDYLARFAPEEVAGLRVITRSAPSPTKPSRVTLTAPFEMIVPTMLRTLIGTLPALMITSAGVTTRMTVSEKRSRPQNASGSSRIDQSGHLLG